MTMKELFVEAMRRTDARDHEGFLAMQHDDATWGVPGARLQGKDQLRPWLELFWQGFSSYGHDLARLYEAGEDTVVCEGTWRGVNDGPLGMPDGTQIPPTGREVSFRSRSSSAATRAPRWPAASSLYFDQLEFLGMLGLVPDPAAV